MPDVSTLNSKPSLIDVQEYNERMALFSAARDGDPWSQGELWRRYRVRIVHHVDTPIDGGERKEDRMAEMATCEVCGKSVKAGGLGVHKARSHGIRCATKAEPRAEPAKAIPPAPVAYPAAECAGCPFRGLEKAVGRALLVDAVRGGMELEMAADFVRRAQVAFGSR